MKFADFYTKDDVIWIRVFQGYIMVENRISNKSDRKRYADSWMAYHLSWRGAARPWWQRAFAH